MKKVMALILCAVLMILAVYGANQLAKKNYTKEGDIYLTLVNQDHKLPDDWLDHIDLVSDFDPWGDEVKVERETLAHFEELSAFLLAEYGIDIKLDSVYRSVADQEWLWNDFKEKYGEDYCRQYLAKPGYSEHHTGLAVDICLVKDGEIINENDQMLAEKEIFSIIHQHLAEYGFILRYPPGKEDITGYSYEPWHFRYVGVHAASDIASQGITLEEYLAN